MPLPPLALIADGFTDPDRADRAATAVEAGVRWVHLRDHEAGVDRFRDAARTLTERLRAIDRGVTISVNTELVVAQELGTGLHLGRRGMGVADARETLASDQPLGYSAHEQVEAEGDRAAHVDYFFFSPIFPTPSKPDHPGVGLAALRAFCRAAPVPVWALGGITPERVADCRQAGAQGVAVCSGIMDVSAPIAAVRAYRRALRTLA